ncbi:hypothetical protein F5X99DRAFT_193921 [Biscogniauxia marginata]|nr:hypothetical protein F5X99DRAFT_193921 [Biscogniauxia marginata]
MRAKSGAGTQGRFRCRLSSDTAPWGFGDKSQRTRAIFETFRGGCERQKFNARPFVSSSVTYMKVIYAMLYGMLTCCQLVADSKAAGCRLTILLMLWLIHHAVVLIACPAASSISSSSSSSSCRPPRPPRPCTK